MEQSRKKLKIKLEDLSDEKKITEEDIQRVMGDMKLEKTKDTTGITDFDNLDIDTKLKLAKERFGNLGIIAI